MLGRTGRLVAVAVVLGAALGTASHAARAAGDLGGYDLSAQAPAVELVVDSDALPVPAHPVFDATVPETAASLQSGLGHGLSSLFWPGDLAGHLGSALLQLNQLCSSALPITLPGVPTECTPLPQVIKDNATALNDPVKAETFAPGGPADDSYTFTPPLPGVTMTSHADSNRVESTAGFATFGAPGLGTLGSVTSHSITTADGSTGTSQATSELFNVSLVGGLVSIDHIQSTAKEVTDGQRATGDGTTIVSGLRIGGVPATVDSTGLHIGSLSAVANRALQALGLQIELTTPNILSDGAQGAFTAPLLVIRYSDDQNSLEAAALALGQKLTTGSLQKLTGSLQQLALGPQAKVALSLGGAAVAVNGSPAFTSPDEPGGGGSGPASDVLPFITTPSSPATSAPSVAGLTFSPTSSGVASPSVGSPSVARPAGFLRGFGGLAWGLVVAAIAGAFALAYGLYCYALVADAAGARLPAGAGCPNDIVH
ncbi:MAG: hypothetical protein JO148_16770 [Acidimicrobiia bacterium]|nr:hypothetical protein [Acidimicrobiia bacterium]